MDRDKTDDPSVIKVWFLLLYGVRALFHYSCHFQVRGLPWEATEMDLCKFFKDCEIVGGPRGIFLCQNDRGQPTGEAFIEMETQADVDTALEKHKQNMGRRWVRVGWSGAGGEGMARGGVESGRNVINHYEGTSRCSNLD